jgi:hypothetical protein
MEQPVESYQVSTPDFHEITHDIHWRFYSPAEPGPVTVSRQGTPIQVDYMTLTITITVGDEPVVNVEAVVHGVTTGGAERYEVEDGPITVALEAYADQVLLGRHEAFG